MIERLYSKLDLQLATMSGFLILSVFFSWVFSINPLLRLSFTTLVYGVLWGLFLILLEIGYVSFINRNKRRSLVESYFSKESLNSVAVAKVLIQATGEETLIRGFLFVPLAASYDFFGSTLIALAVSAFISTVIYSSRENISWFRGIQAIILGIIYLATYSIFAVIVARFIGEISLVVASHYRLPNLLIKRLSYVSKQAV